MGRATGDHGQDDAFDRSVGRRELTATEKLYVVIAAQGCGVVLTVVRIEPAVSRAAMQEAALAVQRRHPMLRARLLFEPLGEPYFSFDREWRGVEVREHGGSLDEAIVAELGCAPSESEPWHLALCGEHVLFSYYHVFLDGRSVLVILQDLLCLVDGVELPDADERAPVSPRGRKKVLGPAGLFPGFRALSPGEKTPLIGKWVPHRTDAWPPHAFGRDRRTCQEWTEQNEGRWRIGPKNGATRILGKSTRASGTVYSTESTVDGVSRSYYGTVTMLPDGTAYCHCELLGGCGLYFRRAEGPLPPPRPCPTCSGPSSRGPPERAEPECLRQPRCIRGGGVACWRQLTPEATDRLQRRCEEEGASMQSILGAALVTSLSKRRGVASCTLETIAQTRQEHEVGPSAVGCFVSWFNQRVQCEGTLWDIARDYRMGISAAMRVKAHLHATAPVRSLSQRGLKSALRSAKLIRCLAGFCGRICSGSGEPLVSVSNRGAVELSTHRRAATSLYTLQTGEFAGSVRLSACTVNGSLCFSLHSWWGSKRYEMCTEVADGMVEELTS